MGYAHISQQATRVRWRAAAAVLAVSLIAVACGGDSGGGSDGGGATTGSGQDATPASVGDDERGSAADVFEEFNSMEGEERKEALIEGAQEEGEVTLYSAGSGWDPVISAFEDKYDIDVNTYIGQADTVLQRVYQEFEAGYHAVDVYDDAEAYIVAQEGMTHEYNNPELTDGLVGYEKESHVQPTRLSVYTQGWNTDMVEESELPDSIDGFTDEKWEGRLGMDPRDWEWYLGASNYYIEEEGWTQEEVDEMFAGIASNAEYHPGHTVQAQLLLAGEFAVSATVYTQSIDRETDADPNAPVAWRKSDGSWIRPLVYTPQGVALMKNAPNPHAAMLWVDFVLEEGARILSEVDGTPAAVNYEGGPLDGIPDEDLHLVTPDELLEKQEEWSSRWDQLLQQN